MSAGYQALRDGCGAWSLARDVLILSGPEALEFLQGQCSQDVATLGVGDGADALLLEPDGKCTALVRLLRLGPHRYSIDVRQGFGDIVAARLGRFRLRTKVEIQQVDWSCLALRGRGVSEVLAGTSWDPIRQLIGSGASNRDDGSEEQGYWIAPVAWNGTVGVDILGPDPVAQLPDGADLVWCEASDWDALRIEAGIPEMGSEIDAKTIAAEANLLDRAVSFTKGCYTGQELVARMDARGNRVARRLAGIVPDLGADAGSAEELVGATLKSPDGDKSVGTWTSGAWCPGLHQVAGLGYIHRSIDVPGPVELHLVDGSRLSAEAKTLPML